MNKKNNQLHCKREKNSSNDEFNLIKKIQSETDLKLRDPEKDFSGKYSNPKGLMVEVSL